MASFLSMGDMDLADCYMELLWNLTIRGTVWENTSTLSLSRWSIVSVDVARERVEDVKNHYPEVEAFEYATGRKYSMVFDARWLTNRTTKDVRRIDNLVKKACYAFESRIHHHQADIDWFKDVANSVGSRVLKHCEPAWVGRWDCISCAYADTGHTIITPKRGSQFTLYMIKDTKRQRSTVYNTAEERRIAAEWTMNKQHFAAWEKREIRKLDARVGR